jgi:2-keto-4-pentenoate hydratase/2-oxohepta-3-ene-1,7-dioic acid hydratase in catechol pathway
MSRNPKVFLQHGDLLVTEVEGIGRIENPVRHISEPGNQ